MNKSEKSALQYVDDIIKCIVLFNDVLKVKKLYTTNNILTIERTDIDLNKSYLIYLGLKKYIGQYYDDVLFCCNGNINIYI